jgi:molecular chaperone DnaK (HSP70)
MGAAIQAGNMAGKEVSTILVDVTPYTFGVSALTDNHDSPSYPLCYVPIVDRNSPIPISKSEVFYTAFDGQEKVKVDVYQGEDQDLDKDILIGTFTMTGLKDVPHGNPILMHLNLDVNGVLHVTAMEKRTGLSRSITIKDTLKKMDAIQLTQAQNRLDVLFGEAPEDAEYEDVEETDTDVDTNGLPVELVRKVQELLQKAQQKMEQASADDQEEIIDLSETVRDALNRQDEEALKEPMEALSEILFYLDT